MPFEVPESWVWVRILDISNSIQYGYTGSAISKGKYKMLRITDIQDNFVDWKTVPFVEIDDKKAENYLLANNDIVFARTGATVGKSFLIKDLIDTSVFASYLIRIQLKEKLNAQYVKYFFESGYYWEQIEDKSVGTGQPNVNGTLLGELQIPVPPLQEQQRLVLIIEKCFALIDQIESNKLSLSQFIKQAKSKILDLAISGKLVPQSPNDEPASILLERMRNEQKAKKSSSDILHYEFDVPEGWALCSLSQISTIISSKPFQILQSKIVSNGAIPVVSQSMNIIEGYSNNTEKSLEVTIPLIVFGDHTRIVKYVDFDFIVGADGVKIIKPNHIYPKYFYYLLLYASSKIEDRGYSRHFQFLEKFPLLIAPLSEQVRIVQKIEMFFQTLDSIQDNL